MTPTLRWLLVAVAIAVIAVAGSLAYRDRHAHVADPGQPMFPHLAAGLNDVADFAMIRDGKTIAMRRTDAGNWVAASKGDYPAAFPLIKQALLQISEMRAMEPAANDLASLVRAGLAPPHSVRVVLKKSDGAVLADFEMGDRTYAASVNGPLSQTQVRLAGQKNVWTARPAPDLPREALNWLDDGLLSIERERIRRMMLTQPEGGILEVARAQPQEMDFQIRNLPDSRRQNANPSAGAANGVALALANLRFEDVAPAAQIDFSRAGMCEMQTFDGLAVSGKIVQQDGHFWILLTAAYEPPPAPKEGAAIMPGAPVDGAAEAAELNRKFAGWAFRLPDVRGHDLTRTLADMAGD